MKSRREREKERKREREKKRKRERKKERKRERKKERKREKKKEGRKERKKERRNLNSTNAYPVKICTSVTTLSVAKPCFTISLSKNADNTDYIHFVIQIETCIYTHIYKNKYKHTYIYKYKHIYI
jgi:hypothetical protein